MSSVILFIIVNHFNVFTTKAFQMITLNINFKSNLNNIISFTYLVLVYNYQRHIDELQFRHGQVSQCRMSQVPFL